MRGDGSGFSLKFKPTTGFTYNFTGLLQRVSGSQENSAVRLQLSVFPPDSIASGESDRARGGDCADLPEQFLEEQHDSGNLTLGSFEGASDGRQSWGEFYCAQGDQGCCEEPSRVGPPEARCDGTYRHYAGESFADSAEWLWTCPLTGVLSISVASGHVMLRSRHLSSGDVQASTSS